MIVFTMLNDQVNYGKGLFRSYQHDHCVVRFKQWKNTSNLNDLDILEYEKDY